MLSVAGALGCQGGGRGVAADAAPADAGCPASGAPCAGDAGCSYSPDGGLPTTCTCTATGWRCDSCPADFMTPGATCTPGTACTYEDWEHGCDCRCDGGGHWACMPETVGSTCPGGRDGGV